MSLGKGFGWIAGGILALPIIIPTCMFAGRGLTEAVKDAFSNDSTIEQGFVRGAGESASNTAKGLKEFAEENGFEIPDLSTGTNGNSNSADECEQHPFRDGCPLPFVQDDDNPFRDRQP